MKMTEGHATSAKEPEVEVDHHFVAIEGQTLRDMFQETIDLLEGTVFVTQGGVIEILSTADLYVNSQ